MESAAAVGALFAAAQRRTEAGDVAGALALYQDYIAQHPQDPLLHAVRFNQGVLLQQLGDLAHAAQAFGEAIQRAPGFVPPYINLGSIHERLGSGESALAHWHQAAALLGAVTGEAVAWKAAALKQSARLLEDSKRLAEAEAALLAILQLQPQQRDVAQHWVALRQRQCRWPVLAGAPGGHSPAALKALMAPLSLATYTDDPLLQLAGAWSNTRQEAGLPRHCLALEDFDRAPRAGRRLRIGYLSSDLRAHAIGFLMAEMFGLHDRDRYEIHAYYCGIPAEDAIKQRIRAQVEHWHDITPLDDDAALALMRGHGIDILIDINGHTRGGRAALLARRPAPAIVNWLGFPGSMGSPFHHYIIADEVIIPPGQEHLYTEAVLRLPCYQPNDRARIVAAAPPGRAEAGLPEKATVFCAFNGPQKITPFGFARWMRILHAVPDSVLWLLKASEEVDIRLRELAAAARIDPARLVFAPMAGNAEHLARYALADLFLDTAPYGAHTTASDALWMGVPVLTAPGRCFASRVCASLVRAAGLPELVCADGEAYVERAVALGRDRPALAALRERLLAARGTSLLFDTPLLVRSLEALFEQILQDIEQGRLPQPELTNLPVYLEIGAALDHESQEFGAGVEAETLYREALRERHRYSPLPADSRLWQGA
ncbi:O-linked N-acetylglucosamine transferase [Pseudoroseomonas cervicalis]|uniref:O-linked N-acetylglucosamine transferase, SPINDLY family protein n=1 Tax=Teichococcus cervicalis TaxID=204525 RepID=UPI00278201C2|nr:O-linked N-acetylglucosamine transferase [Pseudoroseomonas cervicalis]MDQ1077736.1 putative O-linked N-acetylglucosamine transferase (SPINDLY family) [Pseudoroseomonas cervicalis]